MTLHKWLGLEKPDVKYKYFVLEWEEYKNPKVKWVNKLTKEYLFRKEIKWKERYTNIFLCGNLPIDYYEESDVSFYLPFLKSLLQKCVRRKLSKLAVVTSKQMIKQNINVLLRRLTVIMVEDTTLTKEFHILCWLMFSGKQTFPLFVYEWILGIVNLLCCCDVYQKKISKLHRSKDN